MEEDSWVCFHLPTPSVMSLSSVLKLSYPEASRQHMHVARAYLPVDVAKALVVNPLLVQKAVETFYTRDGLQLRVRTSLPI